MKNTDKTQAKGGRGQKKPKIQPEKTKQSGDKIIASNIRGITARKRAEAQLAEQLDELRRGYAAVLGRGMRLFDFEPELNERLRRLKEPPRYPSANCEGASPMVRPERGVV